MDWPTGTHPVKSLRVSAPAGAFDCQFFEARAPGSAALVLLPAVAGVNDYIRRTAQRLNDHGYAVAVLDYYARAGSPPDVSTPEKIGRAVAALADPIVLDDLASTAAAIRGTPNVDGERVGTLGFCIGGMYAMLGAYQGTTVKAAVNYYGSIRYSQTSANKPRSPLDCIGELSAPLLGHFGTYDRLISSADIDDLERALQSNAKPYELFRYHGAPHAFDEDFRPAVFRPAAARSAWRHSLAFLDWHLRGVAPR
jgi:dienelactone hydrolase